MTRKLFYLILLLLPFMAKAQIAVGDWKIHSIYGTSLTNIIDTPDKVYYLVSYNLYSYDKKEQVTDAYNKRNQLSDINITNIYYNYDEKFLVIVYANSNIDFLYDDGKIVNLPDLKDVILSTTKGINDVNFKDGMTYMATDFGYMVLNNKKREVKESHFYNVPIKTIAAVGNKLLLADAKKIYISGLNDKHTKLSDFKASATANIGQILPVNDVNFLFYTGYAYMGTVKEDNTIANADVYKGKIQIMQKCGENFIVQTDNGNVLTYDKTGAKVKTTVLPAEYKRAKLSSYNGGEDYWVLSSKGLRNTKIEDNGTETVLMDFFKPEASTVDRPFLMSFNPTHNKLYVTCRGPHQYYNDYGKPTDINTLSGSKWENVTPVVKTQIGDNRVYGPYTITFDPEDPNTYYMGTWFDGVYKITNNEMVANYNWKNSPLVLNWACICPGVQFDKNNNLWVLEGAVANVITVLPREKQSNPNITKADWIDCTIPGFPVDKATSFIITKKSDIKIMTNGRWGSILAFLDDNSTIDNKSDDVVKIYSSLMDQDEKPYEWSYINCFVEDKNGKVWMGTSNGVVEFDPKKAVKDNFRINHIKVPRNDGTSYADYLLENVNVLCIAVDGANRKWIGTENSGLFLVSEDGSEILEHFTTDNSYLLDNKIMEVECNTLNNSVYVGTPFGMVEYSSNATPAEASFDDVYAYPNPVRPDYTGWITIRGLMDNSLVKIADAVGNVVYTTTSIGGMATWDGCNASGERVKTGVYYVFASQNENDKKSGAVTKILIVK